MVENSAVHDRGQGRCQSKGADAPHFVAGQALGLVGVLLEIPEVVEDEQLEAIELAQRLGELEVALRRHEILHDLVGRGEAHGVALLDQAVAQGAEGVGLPGARQTEGEHVDAALEEVHQLRDAIVQLLRSAHGQAPIEPTPAILVEGWSFMVDVWLPVILAAVKASTGFLDGSEMELIRPWLNLLIAYDIIFSAVAFMVFDYVVEE